MVAHHELVPYLAGLAWDPMEAEDQYQAGVMRLHGVPEDRIRSCTRSRRPTAMYGGSVAVDIPVRDGDVVAAGMHRFTVHERPGHSPSDLVFVVEDGGFALGGDHLIGHISSNPVMHRPLDRPADLRERPAALVAYLDSLRRTAALDIDVVLPGHGPPVERPRPTRRRAARRSTSGARSGSSEALGDGRSTARELALEIWGRSPARSRS